MSDETNEKDPAVIEELLGEPPEIHRMTDDKLKEFVLGLCDGKVFTSEHCNSPDDIRRVFMVVGLGGLSNIPQEQLQNVGILWEWLDKAGPRSINGMPMFLSVRLMHKEDWARAVVAYKKEMDRRDQITV